MLSSLVDQIDKREAAGTSFEGSDLDTSLVIPEVGDEIHGEMNFEQIVGKSAALRRVLKQAGDARRISRDYLACTAGG